ncbi:reverse transcriptase domain-containing protein [Mesorhizobium sp. M0152]|uniref:reverse transcriptase domain-containing protein n=1 Tax=Mesorhizobium sp. M0152 TaxID=2956898 RepID=UPI00333B6F64
MIIVRYADDVIVGFEREDDARRFLSEMRARLEEVALSLHPDKTRLIEFGRHAAANRKQRGLGKPETFAFFESTLICGKSRQRHFQLSKEDPRPHGGETQGHQGGIAAAHALVDPQAAEVAEQTVGGHFARSMRSGPPRFQQVYGRSQR